MERLFTTCNATRKCLLGTEDFEIPDELVVLMVEILDWKRVPDDALSMGEIIKRII